MSDTLADEANMFKCSFFNSWKNVYYVKTGQCNNEHLIQFSINLALLNHTLDILILSLISNYPLQILKYFYLWKFMKNILLLKDVCVISVSYISHIVNIILVN